MQILSFPELAVLVAVCFLAAVAGAILIRRFEPAFAKGANVTGSREDKTACAAAPYPIWTVDPQGNVIWANDAYRRLEQEQHPAAGAAPRTVFPITQDRAATRTRFRAELHLPDATTPACFEVQAIRAGGVWHGFAVPDPVADGSATPAREFTQTLAKTFAQLSTGLAIFDAQRRLQLFNPALVDLSCLPVDFLSTRPDLASFFDALRERRMVPEPRDYSSWRDHIADLAAAAASGRYQETWTLASGSVYEVIGRPHPGGATAFLFQDISAEVTLTRQFRRDLEMYHAAFETLDQPLCVVSEAGDVSLANDAYRRFWGIKPGETLAGQTIEGALSAWAAATQETNCWAQVRRQLVSAGAAAPERFDFVLDDGTPANCRLQPLAGGATLIRFQYTQPAAAEADAALETA